MKNYIKPEFEVHNFDVETSIMTDPTPTATAIAAQNLTSRNNISTTTDSLSKKYYSEYQSGGNWNWEEKK